ncbi:inositol 1,4,5-trisphosphate receptor-interacting protein-like 1, partial [Antrostomus carolinensis]|uniref:inositol 1,4,5-trisphosphate receptor-interacting protein-like 1 n=1 Tax=Antrostomus carolinensis TaxID=279965 RepID=UPI0005287726
AMAAIRLMEYVVLCIVQNLPMVGDELDDATREQMQQREVFLNEKMAQLLQGVEATSLGRSKESPRKEPDKEEPEEEEEASVALDVGRVSDKLLLDLPQQLTMEEHLVHELLRICQELCRNSFMPRLKLAIRVVSAFEGWSPREDAAVHHLLVVLKPPPGHAFHLELGTAEEMPARNSRVRVELECICTRERLVKNMLCFLHHPEEELRRNQAASLLQTLCTGPYLDMEKTVSWFQTLVQAAWVHLPQAQHLFLTLLPSRHSCKLRLANTSDGRICLIEMILGVQQGDSDTFLSIEDAEASVSSSRR